MAKNTINFKLEGFAELEKQLIELGPKVAKKVLRGAVQSAANPIKKLAEAKAPVRYGLLRKSIAIKTRTKGSTSFSVIGPKSVKVIRNGKPQNAARYAHLVEYGVGQGNASQRVGPVCAPDVDPRPVDERDVQVVDVARLDHLAPEVQEQVPDDLPRLPHRGADI